MKKVLFIGLIITVGFISCATNNSSTGEKVEKARYQDGSVGIWLISINNWINGKWTPSAMAFVPGLTDTMEAQFFKVKNYGTSSNPGWAVASPAIIWKADNKEYVVLLVPTKAEGTNGEFTWLFDEAKTMGSGTGDNPVTPALMTNNPKSFNLNEFFNVNELR
jgi:hypothetical protein